MAEGLTFANYRLDQDGVESIYAIGAGAGQRDGVIEEMAAAFGHELTDTPTVENLGGLIGRVGPAKELQENIGQVQEALGTGASAVTIASDWAERSGLLVPVNRSYVTGETIEDPIDLAVMTGGVRNWMARRLERFEELHRESPVEAVLLIAGNRPMKPTEGPDVEEGMVESDYMRDVVSKRLIKLGVLTGIADVDSGVGEEVMERGLEKGKALKLVDMLAGRMAVISNAGAWVQNAGQVRRAAKEVLQPQFDDDGRQLVVVSDAFPLGTGVEPTATHQNPFSAAGQIVRNAQELARHAA
jgi:hypothetical protein